MDSIKHMPGLEHISIVNIIIFKPPINGIVNKLTPHVNVCVGFEWGSRRSTDTKSLLASNNESIVIEVDDRTRLRYDRKMN